MTQSCDSFPSDSVTDMFFDNDAMYKNHNAEFCKQLSQSTRTSKDYAQYGAYNQAAEDHVELKGTTYNRLKLCKLDEAALLKNACNV